MNEQELSVIQARHDALTVRIDTLRKERDEFWRILRNHEREEQAKMLEEETGLCIGDKLLVTAEFHVFKKQTVNDEFHVWAGGIAEIKGYSPAQNEVSLRLTDNGSSTGWETAGVPMNIIRSMRADYLAAHPELE